MSHKKNRASLIDEVISLVSSALSFRSVDEIETLIELVRVGQVLPISEMNGPGRTGMIHLDPNATKEETVAALLGVAEWVDDHWDEIRTNSGGSPEVLLDQSEDIDLPIQITGDQSVPSEDRAPADETWDTADDSAVIIEDESGTAAEDPVQLTRPKEWLN